MKKIISLFALALVIGVMAASAQNVQYTVTTSGKCTNLAADFTVPAGKNAALVSLDVVPVFIGCTSTSQTLTSIYVTVSQKASSRATSTNNKLLYKKTLQQDGLVTESVAIGTVKMAAGNYVLEVSPSAGTKATLTIELSNN